MKLPDRIWAWGNHCFGAIINANIQERSFRFLEESIELVQALDIPKEDVLRMVDYVYGRPVGQPDQEFGGVGITLQLLAKATGRDLNELTEEELISAWTRVEQIRQKQLTKPVRANVY